MVVISNSDATVTSKSNINSTVENGGIKPLAFQMQIVSNSSVVGIENGKGKKNAVRVMVMVLCNW